MKKFLTLVRVLVPALVLASFFGCSSALESDPLSGGGLAAELSAAAQKVDTPPPSLYYTDWGGVPNGGLISDFAALHFDVDAYGDNVVTVIKSDLSRTTYGYDYINNRGEIFIDPDTSSYFSIDAVANILNLDAVIFGNTAALNLLPKLTFSELVETVWETPATPRGIYSSIDIKPATGYGIADIQATFGDGTFPLYELTYYDDVGVGIVQTLGLFYLEYNSYGAIRVVFPNFYGYHPNIAVEYDASVRTITTLANTTWEDANGNTVDFDPSGNATFSDTKATYKYLYNNYRAGGVGTPTSSPSPDGGSFEIEYNGVNPLTMLFYNFRASGNPHTYELLQP